MMGLGQAKPPEPYYPGFRDLNLFFVAICLVIFLYLIAIATTGYRVRSAKNRMAEIDRLMSESVSDAQKSRLTKDREKAQRDYDVLSSSGPGRWFR